MIRLRLEAIVSLAWVIVGRWLFLRSTEPRPLSLADFLWLMTGLALGIIWLWRERYGWALLVWSCFWGWLYLRM